MNLEDIKELAGYVGSVVVLLVTLVSTVLKVISSNREVKKLEGLDEIEEELKRLISEAEEKYDSGGLRKEYVVNKIREYRRDLKLRVSNKEIDKIIEDLVSFSKEVNVKKKE